MRGRISVVNGDTGSTAVATRASRNEALVVSRHCDNVINIGRAMEKKSRT